MAEYDFNYSREKDAELKRGRDIGFEEAILLILEQYDALPPTRRHHNIGKYPNQRIFEILRGDTVYLIPCVVNGSEIFLKTIYPSRKARKLRVK